MVCLSQKNYKILNELNFIRVRQYHFKVTNKNTGLCTYYICNLNNAIENPIKLEILFNKSYKRKKGEHNLK